MAWTGVSVPLLVEVGKSIAPFLVTLIATVLVYFYKPYWSVRHIPGPPTTPLVGHLPLLAKYGPDVFIVLSKHYGSIFRFQMGRQPLVIVADPELCREAGIKKFKDMPNRCVVSPLKATPLHLKGLFMTKDTRWSTMRSTITSLYQPTHISTQLPTMDSVIESVIANLENSKQEEVNFSDVALQMTTDIIGQSAFGVDFGLSKQSSATHVSSEYSYFIRQHIFGLKMDLSGSFSIIIGLLLPILQEPFRQILKRMPWTTDWKIEKTNQNLTRTLDEIVKNRENDHGNQSKDFLTLVLNARVSQKAANHIFTSDYISALTYEHLLTGSATLSFTLSSIFYLVAGHPQVEKKLLREIDDFGPHDLMPTADDLQHKFPYLNQVIKEAMRFYTVSPLIGRETNKQVEINGYILPKGTWVWLAVGVLAKDPTQFPEPDTFRPERFDPNCDEEKERHPYANIPFGIGPRVCIGQKFAIQELLLASIRLYRRFIFRHSPGMENPLALHYGIVLNFKHGVKLIAIKRTSSCR